MGRKYEQGDANIINFKPIADSLRTINNYRFAKKITYVAIPVLSILLFLISIQLIWLAIILLLIPLIVGIFSLKYVDSRINYLVVDIKRNEKQIIENVSKILGSVKVEIVEIEKSTVFNFPAIVRLQSLILKEYKNVGELLDFRYLGSQNLINHIETSLEMLVEIQARNEAKLRAEITQIVDYLDNKYTYFRKEDTYLTYPHKQEIKENFDKYIKHIKSLLDKKDLFSEKTISIIEQSIVNINSIFKKFEGLNKEFIGRRKKEHESIFEKDGLKLDKRQKTAIIKDDKHNLVVAGAGSGKTAVLTTRIAYLIQRKDSVKPSRILALAYQRDARREMEERLENRYGVKVKIKTFHALGLEILKKAGIKSEVYGGNNYDKKYKELINKLYENAKEDSAFKNDIINFLKVGGEEVVERKTEFATEKEKQKHYDYMRNLRYYTLDNTEVKSMGERKIMNFFITHKLNGKDINVIYEKPAPWTKFIGSNDKISYPDFHLEEYGIWHEHWAVDDKDDSSKVPDWFEKTTEEYKQEMAIKRSRFKELKESLIETYGYESKDEKELIELLKKRVVEKLKEKYPEQEFEFTPIEYKELVEKVWEKCKTTIDAIADSICSFITYAKIYDLSPTAIEKRIESGKWSSMQSVFSRIAVRIYRDYEKALREKGCVDFQDMINRCIKVMKKDGKLYADLFDHILVDEYQDISKTRHNLIETLMERNPNCKLFCVGDDWQSIMSFSGSDLRYFVNFDKYFPHPEITKLPMNYRSIKSIVDLGAKIIENNKDLKIDKETVAFNEKEKQVNVYLSTHEPKYVTGYYDQISGLCMEHINDLLKKDYEPDDIMLLTRITKSPMMKERIEGFIEANNLNNIKSVHSSKGLQARAVFLLDVRKGRYGFPCELENPTLLEPAMEEKMHSKEEEERRLFYVAVTRAKEDLFIYSQEGNKSKFIKEIEPYVNVKHEDWRQKKYE